MSQFLHQQLLASALEAIMNQALAMDISEQDTLSQLENQSLIVELEEFSQPFCLHLANSKLLVTCLEFQLNVESDCKIRTSVSTLIKLKEEQQFTELIKQDKLDVIGNVKVAQRFASLIENITIDWPSELEKHLGDIATHKLLALFNTVKTKLNFAKTQINADASEYLVYEQGLVKTKYQIDDFNSQVLDISQQVTQLDSRIERLTQKFSQLANTINNR